MLAEDEIGNDALGRSIAAGTGYRLERRWVIAQPGTPTAYGGFLYPAFVGAVYAATHDDALALFLIQTLIGALAVGGVALAAFRLGGERAALVAGVLAVFHPGLALDSAWVMSEALAVPLLLAAWLLWARYLERPTAARAALFGAAAAAACLTRSPSFYAFGLMIAPEPARGAASRGARSPGSSPRGWWCSPPAWRRGPRATPASSTRSCRSTPRPARACG